LAECLQKQEQNQAVRTNAEGHIPAVRKTLRCGGGRRQNGACVAREAALRGLSVALVDQGDFGTATFSYSQRIVHGDLRYLQHADLKRMRESIRERSILMSIAPHLIFPMPVLIPMYTSSLQGKTLMALVLNFTTLLVLICDRRLDIR
jgi:glycerol-3-phosphate dehydrogenase